MRRSRTNLFSERTRFGGMREDGDDRAGFGFSLRDRRTHARRQNLAAVSLDDIAASEIACSSERMKARGETNMAEHANTVSIILGTLGMLFMMAMAFSLMPSNYAIFAGVACFILAGAVRRIGAQKRSDG